jgi:hypothetical protein
MAGKTERVTYGDDGWMDIRIGVIVRDVKELEAKGLTGGAGDSLMQGAEIAAHFVSAWKPDGETEERAIMSSDDFMDLDIIAAVSLVEAFEEYITPPLDRLASRISKPSPATSTQA